MARQIFPIPTYRKLKRPNGSYLAFADFDGKRQYFGGYGTPESKEAYQRFLAEWTVSCRRPKIAIEDITVVEVAMRYMEWAKGYYVKNEAAEG